ncbi:MAG: calcium-binding protein [Xenococcus sp. MO_188.B8]|nr:calcium-binding protein [Xenococcus sp. MO_188.B8]
MTETFSSLSNLIKGETNTYNSYTFTKIADTSGSFDYLFASSINDSGTVVFSARLDNGSREIIFTGSGGELTTIVDTSSSFDYETFGDPVINNNGTVVIYAAQLDNSNAVIDSGIFTGSGGEITTIAESDERFLFFQSQPDINDSGTVAFIANPPGEFDSLFTATADGEISTIVTAIDNNDSIDSFTSRPQINNSGTVAFLTFLEDNGEAIFTSSDGSLSRELDTSGDFSFVSYPNINNNGSIAFFGSLDEGGSGIFRLDPDGNVLTIADSSDSFSFDFSDLFPAINDNGTIVFTAELEGVGDGIFTGADPVADEVITVGDPLFGSTVEGLGCCTEHLNNSGQIVFGTRLADGTTAIVRADPTIEGTEGRDNLTGTANNERLNGFEDNDLLIGLNGKDTLSGGAGEDFLFGNLDDDVLDGGADDDLLFGGRDADQFVLREGDGRDTIFDYRDGTDSFLLADGLAFEDLTITQGVGQSLISVTYTSEELASLIGVQANVIGAEDFTFHP